MALLEVKNIKKSFDDKEVLKDIKGIGFVHFNQKDIVRHKLVQRIVDAYNKKM